MPTRYISPSTIEDLATAIRRDAAAEISQPSPVDAVRIANSLGCEVETVVFDPDSISAKIQHGNDGKCLIQISNSDGPLRQRFSIAHELSHYVLHDDEDFVEYRKALLSDYDNPDLLFKEVQANMLASALLMPKDMIKKAWANTHDVDVVAEMFNVSKSATYYRLENLGLIGG